MMMMMMIYVQNGISIGSVVFARFTLLTNRHTALRVWQFRRVVCAVHCDAA